MFRPSSIGRIACSAGRLGTKTVIRHGRNIPLPNIITSQGIKKLGRVGAKRALEKLSDDQKDYIRQNLIELTLKFASDEVDFIKAKREAQMTTDINTSAYQDGYEDGFAEGQCSVERSAVDAVISELEGLSREEVYEILYKIIKSKAEAPSGQI